MVEVADGDGRQLATEEGARRRQLKTMQMEMEMEGNWRWLRSQMEMKRGEGIRVVSLLLLSFVGDVMSCSLPTTTNYHRPKFLPLALVENQTLFDSRPLPVHPLLLVFCARTGRKIRNSFLQFFFLLILSGRQGRSMQIQRGRP
jgi:hypothetical protein